MRKSLIVIMIGAAASPAMAKDMKGPRLTASEFLNGQGFAYEGLAHEEFCDDDPCPYVHPIKYEDRLEYIEPPATCTRADGTEDRKYVKAWYAVFPDAGTGSLPGETEVIDNLFLCFGNSETHSENCCNYEAVPGASVYLARDWEIQAVVDYKDVMFWINKFGVDKLADFLDDLIIVDQYIELGPWGVVGYESCTLDCCCCDSATAAGYRDPDGFDNPYPDSDAPTTPGGGWGGVPDGEKGGVYPETGGSKRTGESFVYPVTWGDIDLPSIACTAENDHSSGQAEWNVTMEYEWDTILKQVFAGYGGQPPHCGSPTYKTNAYQFVCTIGIKGELEGDVSCVPHPVSGRGEGHDSHEGCDSGCDFEDVPTAYSYVINRSVGNMIPITSRFWCTTVPRETESYDHVSGYSLQCQQDGGSLGEFTGSEDMCNCSGKEKLPPPDETGVGLF